MINGKDREILRQVAYRKASFAHSPENDLIMKKWQALGRSEKTTPTVRLLFSNFTDEVIDKRMKCEGDEARCLERMLLSSLVGRELFGDDTPLSGTFDIPRKIWAHPFGIKPDLSRPENGSKKGFHINPVIENYEADAVKLGRGSFGADTEAEDRLVESADVVFGDILPARLVMPSLTGAITNPLVMLSGMENYYLAMYDAPDTLHRIMENATSLYEEFYDFLERERLLLPTVGTAPVAQESFAFCSELPEDRAVKTTDCWGFLESQETTAVSPDTFGEFVFPYQDRLVKRFGLLSYGCCERVDAIFPDYLSKWKNLRKLSVSPFNDENAVGEYLRGTNIVYYSKPRAEFVTMPGPLDENALIKYFRGVCEAASGCLFEIAQREVGTIFGDYDRGRRYVEIAKECVGKYWKP